MIMIKSFTQCVILANKQAVFLLLNMQRVCASLFVTKCKLCKVSTDLSYISPYLNLLHFPDVMECSYAVIQHILQDFFHTFLFTPDFGRNGVSWIYHHFRHIVMNEYHPLTRAHYMVPEIFGKKSRFFIKSAGIARSF